MRIGFTCGTYDLFHAGHVESLKEAAALCDYLIVGLQVDPSKDRANKNKPIQTLVERAIQLRGCKYVDEIHVYDSETDLYHYLANNRSRIDTRFLGEDWKGKEFTGYELPIDCYFTPRDHTYSSSELRERIYKAEALRLESAKKPE